MAFDLGVDIGKSVVDGVALLELERLPGLLRIYSSSRGLFRKGGGPTGTIGLDDRHKCQFFWATRRIALTVLSVSCALASA